MATDKRTLRPEMPITASLAARSAEQTKSQYKGGGVVIRQRREVFEILLVTSRSRPGRWILPKGSAEPGETVEVTATREIAEEAGVRGKLVEKLGVVRRPTQHITFFLFHYEDEVRWAENTIRERRWVDLRKAERYLRQSDLHDIVTLARRRLRAS